MLNLVSMTDESIGKIFIQPLVLKGENTYAKNETFAHFVDSILHELK